MLDTESPITDVVTTDPHVGEDSLEPPPGVFDAPVGGGGGGGDMPPGRPRRSRGLFGGGGTGAVRADDDGSGTFDLRNTWQVAAGAILIPLGVIIILIAWYGSAHARVVQQQIPYLVSGSFVGLGCMVVGGFFFFGHWIYRLFDQADLQHEETLRALEAIAAALAGSAPRAAVGGTAPGAVAAPGGRRRCCLERGLLRDDVGDGIPPGRLCRDRTPPRRPAGARGRRPVRAAALPDLHTGLN